MASVCRTLLYPLFLAVLAALMLLMQASEAAPVSDSENAYRILSSYMRQLNEPDLDAAGYIYFGDKSSIKRALGPRPLRFG
ncbi:hypothetical protein FO519_008292 [Halicephalobus sp. NKZ332]|nr:hypothetical protein FO519_008292 [Halicephalobus sp. NKZ332]